MNILAVKIGNIYQLLFGNDVLATVKMVAQGTYTTSDQICGGYPYNVETLVVYKGCKSYLYDLRDLHQNKVLKPIVLDTLNDLSSQFNQHLIADFKIQSPTFSIYM